MRVERSMAAVWTPERFPHVVQASKAAQLSTAFRFKERIKSKGGDTGEDALCSSCSDCRQRVKHEQAAATPPPAEKNKKNKTTKKTQKKTKNKHTKKTI